MYVYIYIYSRSLREVAVRQLSTEVSLFRGPGIPYF